jgi:sporulation protein YlmC with PRC-barrel domain
MKTTKQLLLAGTTAATLAFSTAVQAQVTPPVRDTELPGTLQTDRTIQRMEVGQQKPVTAANKASKLVGMKVRNPQNENLGEIQDLVVDLEAGKIAYAVLSVGGFLGIGERHIAVPLNAFTVAADQDHLVLNADRERIRNAPGLAKDSWPDINSPALAADRWLGTGEAFGTPGETRTGTGFGTQPETHTPPRDTTLPRTTQPDTTLPRPAQPDTGVADEPKTGDATPPQDER